MNQDPWQENQTRRDFIRTCGRRVLIGALAATGGLLVARRLGDRCVNDSRCFTCIENDRCKLPEATAFRRGGTR